MTNDQDEAIRYASVTAAVDDVRRLRPILRLSLELMERDGTNHARPELYQKTRAALELLDDPARLRQGLEGARRADGTVMFRFTPAAAARWKEFRDQVKERWL
jgi:hypothetical protein